MVKEIQYRIQLEMLQVPSCEEERFHRYLFSMARDQFHQGQNCQFLPEVIPELPVELFLVPERGHKDGFQTC